MMDEREASKMLSAPGAGQDPQNQMGIMRTSESVNLMMASQFLSPADLIPMNHSLAAKDREIARLREALAKSVIALDDWLNLYAEDMCDPGRVAEAKKRVHESGALWYIATVQETNRAVLAQDGRE